MDQIAEKWTEIKEKVKEEYALSDVSYSTWIIPLKFYKRNLNQVYILIPSDNAQHKNYMINKYATYFKVTISEIIGEEIDVTFMLENEVEVQTPTEQVEKKQVNISVYESANLNPKYNFDTFVVGNNNKFAHAASLAVAETPGTIYNPLFIYGGSGLGKTHLMHAIGHYIIENNSNMKVLYVTSEQFTNDVIESIRSGNSSAMTKLREKYRSVDVLMIDDVQFIIGKESTQEEFFHTFNVLYEANKQIILSSDKPPKEMQALDERFRSRFEMGLIVDIQSPDYETKVAILQKYSENFGRSISNSILEYVASNIHSNIRELEGALNKIIAYSKINKIDFEEITVEHAEEALKDMISSSNSKVINENLILNVVAEHFNVSTQQILSSKRTQEFAEARQVVMYLCNELTNTTYQNIAKLLGKKDHTTVLHGIKKVKTRMETDEEFNNKINIITSILSPN
ncbi:MAG: chromosomal replication initiator protein DnaA [Lachnospiraceae bacterium]|jgi:chromosomal replication initiator protein|nr:chromosomal replication initiator protein DnaA [Lachnospiraceae bacterium]